MTRTTRTAGAAGAIDVRTCGAIGDGMADDTAAIQHALDQPVRTVVIPDGVYKVSTALRPRSGQELVIDGTLCAAPSVIQRLTADVQPGENFVEVADASAYRVGYRVAVADDRLPKQGGGMGRSRPGCAECGPVARIEGNRLFFDHMFHWHYAVAANAHAGSLCTVLLLEDCDDVLLHGRGAIDGNKAEQFDVAPSILGRNWPAGDRTEEQRVGCCIYAFGTRGRLRNIVIRDLTLRNALLHNLTLMDADGSRVLDATLTAARDKNLLINGCRDCLVRGNLCTDSEFEDGIILHQVVGQARPSQRILIQGNICRDNARNGIHIGAGHADIHTSGNLCAANGFNLWIAGANGSSTGDVSLGDNYRVYPRLSGHGGVWLSGQGNRIVNLTARGAADVNVFIRARDLALIGGSIGGDETARSAAGLELSNPAIGKNKPYAGACVAERVLVQGVLISRCQAAVRVACDQPPCQVRFRNNTLIDNDTVVAGPSPEALAAVNLGDNEGCEMGHGVQPLRQGAMLSSLRRPNR